MRYPVIILAALIFISTGSAFAATDGPGVIISPFQINSDADLSYLADEIPRVIGNRLKEEGARILDTQFSAGADLAELGMKAGADFVISGSLFWVNQRYSLDIRMLELFSGKPAQLFSKDGQNIENLIKGVQDLAKSLSLKLFRREVVENVKVSGNHRN